MVVTFRQRWQRFPVTPLPPRKIPPRFWLGVAIVLLLGLVGSPAVHAKPRPGAELLLDTYQRNLARLTTNSFGLPIFLESFEGEERVHVDVYGIFAYPFGSIAGVLKVPANWCDIVSLHPNVKSCTYLELPNSGLLTFYIGKKVYQPPEDTRQVLYQYRVVTQLPGYLDIVLAAGKGPFGTVDHHMRFEALPLDGSRTFVHVSYEYRDSKALRLAGRAYFATLGRGKIGFTVTGKDRKGQDLYIGGPRGAIERNAVRYYLAIQSFMETMRYPTALHFGESSSEWYELTRRYPRQLLDLDKHDYLAAKTTEHRNQLLLQRRLVGGKP